MPIHGWMDTHNVVHPQTGILALKRKDVLTPAAARMGLGDTVLSDISRHRRTDSL